MQLNNQEEHDGVFSRFKDFGQMLRSFDWAQTREQISQEGRARIVVLGLTGAGKSTLFNKICGWSVSSDVPNEAPIAEPIEDYGLFCLIDLPQERGEGSYSNIGRSAYGTSGPYYEYGEMEFRPVDDLAGTIPMGTLEPLELAEGADLLVYVLDGEAGVRSADYRWVGRLRRLSIPLIVVWNKCDLADDGLAARRSEIEGRLGSTVLPVSALHETNIKSQLLPKMIDLCPNLTVALGRELGDFRRRAAERVINHSAVFNGILALEPVPLLDLPVQALTITGMLLRISAIYDRPPSEVRRREVWLAIGGGLAGRYTAQQLAKLLPVVGWLISGAVSWSTTWGLGRAMVTYFEAGGDEAVGHTWRLAQGGVAKAGRAMWQRRPRLSLRWFKRGKGRNDAGNLTPDAEPVGLLPGAVEIDVEDVVFEEEEAGGEG